MPSPCWVPKCNSNYRNGPKESVFRFPSDEKTRQAWISAIKREDSVPTRHSRVCAKHFREEDLLTVSEAYNDKTGEFIRVPLDRKRILPNAVPSIFPNSSSFTSSKPSNARENTNDKGKIKKMESLKAETVNLQEQVRKECEQISTIQNPYGKLNSHKSDYWTVITDKNAIILLPLNANQGPTNMPLYCSAYGCNETWVKGGGITFHCFPKEDERRKAWEVQLRRENFKASNHSKICSKHFTEDCFDKNKFGGTWLKPDALPTIFNFPDHLQKKAEKQNPVKRLSAQNEDVDDKDVPGPSGILNKKQKRLHYVGDFSEEDVTSPTKAKKFLHIAQEQTSSLNKKIKSLNKKNDNLKRRISSLEEMLDELRQNSFISDTASSVLGTISGTESQNVAETSTVIKQEPIESVDEPPQLVIKKIYQTEEMASSSRNSSSSCGSAPLLENAFPSANPDSTNVDKTPAAHIPNKPVPKREINDAEPDTVDATPDAAHAKLCLRTIPSKRNRNLHPPAVTSKKSTGRSTLPTKNGENATREMFQSLLDDSENNPLFGSRTTERPGDLFDVFADFIADKLREMDWDDCAYALRAILDVVFKADKVQHDTEVK